MGSTLDDMSDSRTIGNGRNGSNGEGRAQPTGGSEQLEQPLGSHDGAGRGGTALDRCVQEESGSARKGNAAEVRSLLTWHLDGEQWRRS